MRPRRDPVPRARAATHWLAGILVLGLLAGGVVSAAALLWENLDVRQLAPVLVADPGPLPLPEPPLAAGHEPAEYDAVLFRSLRNRAFYPDRDYYQRSLDRWGQLIRTTGGKVRVATNSLELEQVAPHEVLVVPDAPCLSEEEVRAMRAHLSRGGSVVSNWAVGARDERCSWRGWGTVAQLTGAPDVRELPVREALYMVVPAGTPLSPGLDPGTRIELIPEPSLALTLGGARVYWSDWALNPQPDESGGGADVAALAVHTPAGGTSTWFGFRLTQSATPADSAYMDRVVVNGIRWAAGLATAGVSAWPDGRRAALVIAEDVEAAYENAHAMADLLREEGVRGSFYPVSQMVLDDVGLAQALRAAGEVGSQTSDHQRVAGLTHRDQAVRLRRGWSEIRNWTGVPPDGLRPPEEAFDANTLRAWSEAGGTYVLAVNEARSASPEIHAVGEDRMAVLPRLIKDDYNVFVQEGAMRAERLEAAYLDGLRKVRSMGGLAVVASHTQIIGSVDSRLSAIRRVIQTANGEGDWWIAAAGDVARWWRSRATLSVTMVRSGPDGPLAAVEDADAPPGFQVVVQASGNSPLTGVWIDLVLPRGAEGLGPLVDDEPVPYLGTPWGLRVPVGDLDPGARRVISLIEAS